MTCGSCAAELDHCHGTLVRHVLAPDECTDPACYDLDADRHPLVAGCTDLDGCACVASESALAAAS
ncbi:hypothetical protein DW322_05075 [Rhodococcus rhodnii]|uniref:Uncharacterized protein n=1 Tax=Rhodococcus rhodnii TaxID=38312 RepID=A0A6P2CKN5_9NOCA|nr:hypothetical protein DW322_05075 [Rhodococcus rhodnii]